MSAHEDELRAELRELAARPPGRELLQFSLRGIASDGRGLTAGCWVKSGIAGCLFQHAYWQGVREGAFPAGGNARDWVSAYAGTDAYWNVIRTIAAFDELAREEYLDGPARRIPIGRGALRSDAWRARVEQLLVETLDEAPPPPVSARRTAAV